MVRSRDPLTGLYLRDEFLRVAEKHLTSGSPFALALIDIDKFKIVNDVFGHQVGDKVLQELANFIKQFLRKRDIFVRYGGDEFIILLPEADRESARKVVDRIKNLLEMETFNTDPPIHISFSAGIAAYPDDGSTVQELLARADSNLFKNKRHRDVITYQMEGRKFIDRKSELMKLRRELVEIKDGRSKVITVEGPPGIGKSAFIKEGFKFIELLNYDYRVIRFLPHRKLRKIPACDATITIYEDIHNLNEEELEDLLEIITNLKPGKGIILSFRPGEIPDSFRDSLIELEKDGYIQRIKLKTFDGRTTSEFLQYYLSSPVNGQLVEFFQKQSGGNPFLLHLILKEALRNRIVIEFERSWFVVNQDRLEVPEIVKDMVVSQLRKLPEDVRSVLLYSSLLDGEVNPWIFEKLLDLEPERIARIFESLVSSGWFYETDEGRFDFVHGIVKRAVRDSISRTTKQLMYTKLSDALERYGEPEEVRAVCYLRAGQWEKAYRTAVKIGEHLLSGGYIKDAVRFFEIAEKALENIPLSTWSSGKLYKLMAESFLEIGDLERASHYINLAEKFLRPSDSLVLHYRLGILKGDLESARNALQKLIKISRKTENRLKYKIHLFGLLIDTGEFEKAKNLYSELKDSIKKCADPSLEISFCVTVINYATRIHTLETKECLERLKSFLDQDIKPVDRLLALSALGVYYLKETDLALSYLKEALKISREIGNLVREATILVNIGLVWSRHGYQSEAIKWFKRALKAKEKIGDEKGVIIIFLDLGYAHSMVGEFEQAEKILKDGLLKNKYYVKSDLLAYHLWHGMVYNYTRWGKYDLAMSALANLEHYVEKIPSYLPGEPDLFRGFIYLKTGRPEEAEKIYKKMKPRYEDDYGYYFFASEFLIETGRASEAIPLIKKILQIAEKAGYLWEKALLLRYLGSAYAKLGNLNRAKDYLRKSKTVFEQIQNDFEAGKTERMLRDLSG